MISDDGLVKLRDRFPCLAPIRSTQNGAVVTGGPAVHWINKANIVERGF